MGWFDEPEDDYGNYSDDGWFDGDDDEYLDGDDGFRLIGINMPRTTSSQDLKPLEPTEMILPDIIKMPRTPLPSKVKFIDVEKENPEYERSVNIAEMAEIWYNREALFMANPRYMEDQSDINSKMRAVLNDWLFTVTRHIIRKDKGDMVDESEVYFSTVSLLDRFLSVQEVKKTDLQLVGVSCLLIAFKYDHDEYEYKNILRDLIYVSDNAFTKNNIIDMEWKILTALDFKTYTAPTSYKFYTFIQFLLEEDKSSPLSCLALYFISLTSLDYTFIRYKPSVIASGAFYLALKMKGMEDRWDEHMIHYTHYTPSELQEVAKDITTDITRIAKGTILDLPKVFGCNSIVDWVNDNLPPN